MMEARRFRSHFNTSIRYAALLALSAVFLLPLVWMVSTAFKDPRLIYASPPIWIPNPPTLDNFLGAWDALPFPLFIRNTVVITALSMAGALLSSSLVGFGFATLEGRGKDVLFGLLLATMMVPPTVTLIPVFILFARLGWINTFLPLIVPQFFANAFYVFLFRQFFRTIPRELFESAELDGCSPAGVYWRIALPLSQPALATVAVFAFVASWNDFLGPLIYISSNTRYTLALGLSLFQGMFWTQLHYLMPMSLVALLPVLALFLLAQRYFVGGIVMTGLKG